MEGPISIAAHQSKRTKVGNGRHRKPARSIAELRISGRLNKAEILIKQTLRADPTDATALHQSGLIAQDRGNSGRAVQLLQKAVAAQPDAADIRCDLGLALKAIGRFDAYERLRVELRAVCIL